MKLLRPTSTAASAVLAMIVTAAVTAAMLVIATPGTSAQSNGASHAPSERTAHHGSGYAENLAMIQQSSVRNTNHDSSPWRDTPMDQLVATNHLGPRADYLGNPAGNPENAFPTLEGGQFRTSCEFSHFAYDDPIVHPGQPGAAHLHMFWGNTDVNAHSSYDTLLNSGSSTCNGQELNRTGYWAPAMFDGAGNVRIPERVVVYYKGEGLANGASAPYPPGAAVIPSQDINTVSVQNGGAQGKFSFKCSDQWSGAEDPQANTIPACDGSRFFDEYGVIDNPHVVLEMNVKFPQCWNGQDASDPANYAIPEQGGWYYSLCPAGWTTLPNLEYFINYRVDLGENTSDWYLSSDIDPTTFEMANAPGASLHADWWGAWEPDINQQWLDNCVNFSLPGELTGCGMGYLTNGGPDGDNPRPGPALKFRPQYDGPAKVAAATLFDELCPTERTLDSAQDAAYCTPSGHSHEPEPVPTLAPEPEPTPPARVRTCRGRTATVLGTSRADVIVGTDGDDVIWAGGGEDRIDGGAGNDVICGGSGNDLIYGGPGDDVIYGGAGYENIFGGPGDDRLIGGSDDDWIFGGDGDDWVVGSVGDDELHGDAGNDDLRGRSGDDLLVARGGVDDLRGNKGTDTCARLPGDTGPNRTCEIIIVID